LLKVVCIVLNTRARTQIEMLENRALRGIFGTEESEGCKK
jgi:hypothetical protein